MELKKKWISIALLLISIFLIGVFLYQNSQVFDRLENLNPIPLILIALMFISSLYVNGLCFKILTQPFKIDVKEHFSLSISTSFFNLVSFFSGGMGVRALYMKKKFNLKYSDFLASLFGNYAVILLVNSAIGLIVFVIIYLKFQIFNLVLVLAFSAIFLSTVFCMTIRNFHFGFDNFFTRNVNKMIEGWKKIIRHKGMVYKLATFVVINLLLGAITNWIAFRSIGINLDFTSVLYLSVITTLSVFTLNITPGQLGITEGLYVISGNILGIPNEQSLLVSLLIRAVNITILAILGPISNMILLKKVQLSKKTVPGNKSKLKSPVI